MRRPARFHWASSGPLKSPARSRGSPPCCLLDEPAAGLRHLEKLALAELLAQLRTQGLGILVVEHDMEFVMNLADRVTVMEFGTVIAQARRRRCRPTRACSTRTSAVARMKALLRPLRRPIRQLDPAEVSE